MAHDSIDRQPQGTKTRSDGLPASTNRGLRAPREGSGAVIGSGSGAGGGGGAEDFDSDPQAAGGRLDMPGKDDRPDKGGDAPSHGSR